MTDENAMKAVSEGDLDKAAILFERYQKSMFNFFLKLTYDREASQDMTQNLFYRIIRYRKSYNSQMLFRPWIYQMARNVQADHYRKDKIKKSEFADMESISIELMESHAEADQQEREINLHKALAKLEKEQREILIMNKFQKLKYEEIAKILDTTPGAVKVKAHRAIKKLKGIYFMVEKSK
ncbi:sigma-70 family RNA polymerase sigma factor [Flammeovirgaceae bacterium SG7u.111]|nr:sigma-70 family RNA polymerase sigma factor [Flammeovirgaceae bacterium SG7u.132]WPO38670.1 sigma-70 family RNA polymerase sigma factor [Flammeovirgaceae bacterium SG7u.111]